MDGYGCGGRDGSSREDEDVCHVGKKVREDDEGHGGMNDTGEVAVRVEELAYNIVGVVPAVKGPEAGVKGDSPIGGINRGTGEPRGFFPVSFGGAAAPGEASSGDDDASDGYAEEGDEFEEHKDISHAGAEFC